MWAIRESLSGYPRLFNSIVPLSQLITVREDQLTERTISLPGLLQAVSGQYESSDPRDQIIALLGLADDLERRKLAVDYNLTTPQVFSSSPVYCLRQSSSPFLFLSYVTAFHDGTFHNVSPSWVPDLSSKMAATVRLFSNCEDFSSSRYTEPEISI